MCTKGVIICEDTWTGFRNIAGSGYIYSVDSLSANDEISDLDACQNIMVSTLNFWGTFTTSRTSIMTSKLLCISSVSQAMICKRSLMYFLPGPQGNLSIRRLNAFSNVCSIGRPNVIWARRLSGALDRGLPCCSSPHSRCFIIILVMTLLYCLRKNYERVIHKPPRK